jgi:hypothetical protein
VRTNRALLGDLQETSDGASWSTYGFPDTSPDLGKATEGTISSSAAAIDLAGESTPVLQLYSNEAAAGEGGQVQGYSGGPVLVRDRVVGILCAAPIHRTSGRSQEGTLYALPWQALEGGPLTGIVRRIARRRSRRWPWLSVVVTLGAGLVGLALTLSTGPRSQPESH